MTDIDADKLLTIDEGADAFGVPKSDLHAAVTSGRIPSIHASGRRPHLLRASDVRAFARAYFAENAKRGAR